jgi:tetratricopeptide (TPR) repeat protein
VNRWADQHGRSISIPGSHSQHLAKIQPITRRLTAELGRAPTHQEIAAALGCSVAVLEQVVAEHPEHGAGWRLKGDLLLETAPEQARTCYSASLRSNGWLPDDLIRLGLASLQSGKPQEARSIFETVLAIQPGHPTALKGLERSLVS